MYTPSIAAGGTSSQKVAKERLLLLYNEDTLFNVEMIDTWSRTSTIPTSISTSYSYLVHVYTKDWDTSQPILIQAKHA